MNCGGIFLGKELLSLIESTSNNSSPLSTNCQKMNSNEKANDKSTVNNIVINNYNGNVLKNITNLEPYASKTEY